MPHRLTCGRRLSVSILVLLSALIGAPNASAHNGFGAAYKGHVGAYIVYAYDGDLLSKRSLEYRLVLLNARTKTPIYNVRVGITATWPGYEPAVATVTTFGNVYFYDLPNPYPRDWRMHLTLTGSLGSGHATYKMHGAAPTSTAPTVVVTASASTPWGATIGGVVGGVAIAAVVVLTLRRRRRQQRDRSALGQPASGSSPPDTHRPEPLRDSSDRSAG